ncbi:DUF397 domain-containing protein [Streptomyces sp. NPDC059740]|uniref:DUF397 domain-containing protein n=1 Tax=Streptomyces sp. NPDC059740 TaxID=3346926 RepID=UPI003647DD2B
MRPGLVTSAPQAALWHKSTHSGSDGGDCVEVAATGDAVSVRDTKNRQGPALHHSPAAWRTFLNAVRG